MTPTHEQRVALTQMSGLTLNGEPCRIIGASEPFAQIVRHDGLRAEWSWTGAWLIAHRHGRFQT